jgi:hypothetical protein
MKLFSTLGLFTGFAAAGLIAPQAVPESVRILGVSLLGSGCPAGSADVQIDETKTLLEVTFSDYIVQTGPDTKAADWRKNCKLTLNMAFDEGFQYVSTLFFSNATILLLYLRVPRSYDGITQVSKDDVLMEASLALQQVRHHGYRHDGLRANPRRVSRPVH